MLIKDTKNPSNTRIKVQDKEWEPPDETSGPLLKNENPDLLQRKINTNKLKIYHQGELFFGRKMTYNRQSANYILPVVFRQ